MVVFTAMKKATHPRPAKQPGVMRDVLSTNLQCLLSRRFPELRNVTAQTMALAKEAQVGHGTIQRVIDKSSAATLDTIERLALALDVSVYQILLPNLDCDNPPVVKGATAAERHLYAEFKRAAAGLRPGDTLHEEHASYRRPARQSGPKRMEDNHGKK